jgi:hypothetical protein
MPRLPWLLGPYWPMVRIRTPVSYAAVVVESARVFAMSCSFPAVLLIDSVIALRAVAATNDTSPAVGPQTNVCGSITASCQLPERSRSSGLFECTHGCIARGGQVRHRACTNLV